MKIQLVSFSLKHKSSRIKNLEEIINNSQSDLILFPGWALASDKEIEKLSENIKNNKVVAIIEATKKIYPFAKWEHVLYVLKEGQITPMYCHQLFAERKDIKSDPGLVAQLIQDLKTRKTLNVCGKKIMVLQCGETSILRNIQSEYNRAVFCLDGDTKLKEDFEYLLRSVDIVLNPIHTQQVGNQAKHKERRKVFSDNGRAYLSVANVNDENYLAQTVHYVAIDGQEVGKKDGSIQTKKQYCSWIYEL